MRVSELVAPRPEGFPIPTTSPPPLRGRSSFLLQPRGLPPAAAVVIGSVLAVTAGATTWSVDPSVLSATSVSMARDGSGNVHLALHTSSGTIIYKERVG